MDKTCGKLKLLTASAKGSVRLLTHVICNLTDWPDKYHGWGAPTRAPSKSKSR